MISLDTLKAKREQLVADMYALQGAIQLLDNLIAEAEQPAMTLDELKAATGARSVEMVHEG